MPNIVLKVFVFKKKVGAVLSEVVGYIKYQMSCVFLGKGLSNSRGK